MRIWYQSYVDYENGAYYWDKLRAHLAQIVDPGTEIEVHGITPHGSSFTHSIVEFRCAREVICNAIRAEREGYDAFIIGHSKDSGLYECRSVVDIPVVALGESSMLHACQLGQRTGIVTTNPRHISWYYHQIRRYGLEHRVAGVHAMTFEPGEILCAFADDALAREVERKFADQAWPLVAQGVDVLIPGGGVPMLLFSRIRGHVVDGAPVINGIPIVVKAAETAVKLRRLTGLGVSRTSDYAKAPPHVIAEFLTNPKGL